MEKFCKNRKKSEKIGKNILKVYIVNNMQCEFCSKTVSTEYILKTHQRTKTCMAIQAKKGIIIQPLPFKCIHCHKAFTRQDHLNTHMDICKNKPTHFTCTLCKEQVHMEKEIEHKTICKPIVIKEKKQYPCTCCHKYFASQQKLNHHLTICKEKKALEMAHVERDQKKQHQLEQNVRKIEETVEEKMEQMAFEIRNNKEELEYELRIKENKIKELEQTQSQLVHKLEQTQSQLTVYNGPVNIIQADTIHNTTTTNTVHNNVVFTNYITPERIDSVFRNYPVEKIMGGQKAFSDTVLSNLVNQNGSSMYICTDRSRKKCGYIDEKNKFVEDPYCDSLVKSTLPALPHLVDSYKSSTFDKKYNPMQPMIKKGMDDIMKMDMDRSGFVNQLCRRLPSTLDGTTELEETDVHTQLIQVREEVDAYDKEEQQEKHDIKQQEEHERVYGYVEPVARMIGGVRLGALDIFFQRYQKDGTLKVHPSLLDVYGTDDTVTHEYDELIQYGRFHGERIWNMPNTELNV